MTHLYYPELARQLFELAVEIKEKLLISLDFINLSGGIGVNYRPDQEPNDIALIGEGVRKGVWRGSYASRSWWGQDFHRIGSFYVGTSRCFGYKSDS